MKKILLIGIVMITSLTIFSQEDEKWSPVNYMEGKRYPGYIIKNDGVKIDGHLEAQSRGSWDGVGFSNQNRAIFYSTNDDSNTKETFKANELKAYVIGEKYYKSMNYSGGLTSKPIRFLLRIGEGQIARYVWYSKNENPSASGYWEEQIVLQKGDESPASMSSFGMGFAKKMSAYVSDYKELSEKISNKEEGYRLVNYDKIIDEYNKWYSEKQ